MTEYYLEQVRDLERQVAFAKVGYEQKSRLSESNSRIALSKNRKQLSKKSRLLPRR